MRVSIVTFLMILLFFSGCTKEPPNSPVEPGGEMSALVGKLPENSYYAIGYLDLSELLSSDFGKFMTTRFAPLQMGTMLRNIKLEESLKAAAVAVQFNSRSYPNFFRSFFFIAIAETGFDDGMLEPVLALIPHTRSDFGGKDLLELNTSELWPGGPGKLYLSPLGDGRYLLSNSESLIHQCIETHRGTSRGLSLEGDNKALLSKVDFRSTGWLAVKQSNDAKNLLKFLEPFDNLIAAVKVDQDVDILSVMEFDEDEGARRAVAGFKISMKQMDEYSDLINSLEDGDGQSEAIFDFLELFSARQDGVMAIYSARITTDWLSERVSDEITTAEPETVTEADEEEEQ